MVVRNDLCLGNPIGFDLPIDEEAGNACPRGTAHCGNGRVSTSVIQDDGRGIRCNRRVDQVVLPVGIVVMRHQPARDNQGIARGLLPRLL